MLYRELPETEGGARSGWFRFGADDQLGLINRQSQETVLAASAAITSGRVFPLNVSLDYIDPPLFGRKASTRRVLEPKASHYFDDVHDGLYPQASSQWDSLAHVGFKPGVFYNGVSAEEVRSGLKDTVEHYARKGIVGRGVLLDIERTLSEGYHGTSRAFSVDELELARSRANIEFQTGDILLLHTGFLRWYGERDATTRSELAVRSKLSAPGIEHTPAMAEYLWDSGISAIVSDNPAVEVWPPDEREESWPFGYLHQILIGQLGMALGELWWLDDLARDSAADGKFTSLVVSAPMNAPGGIGSPANAVAIK